MLKKAFNPESKAFTPIRLGFWALVGAGAYLELFGPDLGRIFGKRVYLDAGPNWNYAALLLVALVIPVCWPAFRDEIRRKNWRRLGIVIAGAVLGYLPELSQKLLAPGGPRLDQTWSQSFEESMQTLASLPRTFRLILAGDPQSLFATASALLGVLAPLFA